MSTEFIHMAELVEAAIAVRTHSYSPYSGYSVGAAVLDEKGRIHSGTNVENAAYPDGVCAETAAIAAMIAGGGRRIEAVAVAGPEGEPCTPCGGCRQRIREFAAPETPILICDPDGARARFTLTDLLPASFGPGNLSSS